MKGANYMKEIWDYLPDIFCERQTGYPHAYGTLKNNLEESLSCIISYIASGLDFLGIQRDILHVFYKDNPDASGENESDYFSMEIVPDSNSARLIITNLFLGIHLDDAQSKKRCNFFEKADPFQYIDIKLRILYQRLYYAGSQKIYEISSLFTRKKCEDGKLYIRNLSLECPDWTPVENNEDLQKDALAYSYQLRTIRYMFNSIEKPKHQYNEISNFNRTLNLLGKKDKLKIIVSDESFSDIYSFNQDKMKNVMSEDISSFVMDSDYNTCIQSHYSDIYNQMFNPIHFSFAGELSISNIKDAEFVAKNHILFILDIIKESGTDKVILAGAGGLFDRIFFREACKFFVQNNITVKVITFYPPEKAYPPQNRIYYDMIIPDIIQTIGAENVIIEKVDLSKLQPLTMLAFRQQIVSMMADDICEIIKE
jgi:hypothetical protein